MPQSKGDRPQQAMRLVGKYRLSGRVWASQPVHELPRTIRGFRHNRRPTHQLAFSIGQARITWKFSQPTKDNPSFCHSMRVQDRLARRNEGSSLRRSHRRRGIFGIPLCLQLLKPCAGHRPSAWSTDPGSRDGIVGFSRRPGINDIPFAKPACTKMRGKHARGSICSKLSPNRAGHSAVSLIMEVLRDESADAATPRSGPNVIFATCSPSHSSAGSLRAFARRTKRSHQ